MAYRRQDLSHSVEKEWISSMRWGNSLQNCVHIIWCFSKLGNIFKSPTAKKIFLRGRRAKSIEHYVKLKYAPKRSFHIGARNTLKIMFFYF